MTNTQTDLPTTELDWANGDIDLTPDNVLADVARFLASEGIDRGGVTVEVITMRGPGGGWPLLRFTAEPDVLDRIEDAYFAESDDPSQFPTKRP